MRFLFFILFLAVTSQAVGQLRVAVSVLPQKIIAQQIGGDLIDIQLIVKPGADPHTFDLTPRQLSQLKKADFYWSAAVSFEKGLISRLHEIYPNLKVFDAVQVSSVLMAHGEEVDPHIWLSPQLNLVMADQLRGHLSDLDPLNAFAYDQNYQAYALKIAELDQQIKAKLLNRVGRPFLVFHPAWGHFSEAYGLRQIAVEHEGKEPGARYLGKLLQQMKQEKISIIIVQPHQDVRLAHVIAKEINAKVIVADPLSATYLNELLHVADVIAGNNQ